MQPLVTIAIPTYKRLEYLKEAVASALNQTYPSIEVLIGDDGSDPALRAWCEQQVISHPQVRYQKNEKNLGLAGNWNALVDSAHGDFIVIIGDDDRLLPEFVERCAEASGFGCALIFTNHFVIDAFGQRIDEKTIEFARRYERYQLSRGILAEAEAAAWGNMIAISAALLSTAAVRELRFRVDLNNPEIELFIRLAQMGQRFYFLPDYLVEYRIHIGSATASGLKSDALVDYLIEIPVRPEIEPHKENLIAGLIVNAVSRSLLAGKRTEALRLLRSRYYLRRHHIGFVTQKVCAHLPAALGQSVYRLIWKGKQRSKKIRSTQ